jgi:hypothetical protein
MPATSMLPESMVSSRSMQRSAVDLPEPEAPMMAIISPRALQGHAFQDLVVTETLVDLVQPDDDRLRFRGRRHAQMRSDSGLAMADIELSLHGCAPAR